MQKMCNSWENNWLVMSSYKTQEVNEAIMRLHHVISYDIINSKSHAHPTYSCDYHPYDNTLKVQRVY